MRPLEWCLVLAFLPLILLAFGPPAWRRYWRPLSVVPALVALLQVVLAGSRWQLAPLYLLAAVLPAIALLARDHQPARWLRWGSGVAVAGMVAGSVFAAGYALPVITLPPPTGPYAVGVMDRELVDTTRDRRLMATVWYPAAATGDPAPLTHYPDQLMAGMANLTGLPGIVFQHLRYIDVTAGDNAPLMDSAEPFPVLVFSHGMVGTRLQNASMLQDLASWGYVVLALDHTDAAAVTTFPDGETRFYDPTRFGLPSAEAPDAGTVETNMLPVWVADQQFAFDTLEDWQENDLLFAGTLDLDHLGAFGHSFGGATSLEVCRIDERCRAAADLDGGLYGAMRHEPTVRPALLMTSAGSATDPKAMAGWGGLLAQADAPALWLELPGSSHLSFTDMELLSPLLPPPGFDPRAGLAQVTHDLRVFFDTYLREKATPDDYTLPSIGA
jgi:predicted dienelactone hydrolase